MERELPQQIYEIRDLILQSVEAEKIYLFGSYAYGTPTEDSDYDFYIVLPDGYPMERREVQIKICHELGLARKTRPELRFHPCDFLANYKTHFEERSIFPTLEQQIVEEGVVLYERN